ncbi:HNH endonuclease [Corallococcus sp. AS-1-6]|uniref:HNH endonuclease n=1 Tax=Corallococcus sp. AS-1-6 TaxID=2874599 RepID=UPI001CC0CC5D|nr:HNH endonuclease [Corallococcus sp. AS-1-6]MBZ4372328.1 HNH endonuclease [Corallococcus sp. AS-1-6]
MTLTLVQRSLLEKVAQDNGFDVPETAVDPWLSFASTQVPLRLWLGAMDDAWLVAFSQPAVAAELLPLTGETSAALPSGAAAAGRVADLMQLHRVVRRAYQLSGTLPDELFHLFERVTKDLPQTTEVERLTVQRVGQDLFREGLLRYWEGRCAVTGLSEPELLRASHIRPWAKCETAQERLNVFNGILLAVHLDAAFDRGFITFEDGGRMVISSALSPEDSQRLGLNPGLSLTRIDPLHRTALAWHRANCFRGRVSKADDLRG